MDIVCTIDHNYVRFCNVMLASLFENNKSQEINVHLISDSLGKSDKELFQNFCKKYNQQISFYKFDKSLTDAYPIKNSDYVTLSAYYRLFLPQIIPNTISKILYLDPDIIVCKSIADFWNIDISNKALACVEDTSCLDAEIHTRLLSENNHLYFNSGVLYINLDYMRKNNTQDKLINFIINNHEKIVQHDQDVLNAVLHENEILFVPARYNMQDGFLKRIRRSIKNEENGEEKLNNEIKNTAIIHYTGSKKPWQSRCQSPFKEYFTKYQQLTEFKNIRPKFDLWASIKKIHKAVFIKLGLKKPKYKKTQD